MDKIDKKLIVILGPTGSGKTALAIKIAKKLNGEVISADSRQIYRGMDIGTAKPELETHNLKLETQGIVHHLIDIKNPDENYTVAEFKDDAVKTIKEIQARGKLPILCGGTGLYIDAIVKNLEIPRVPPNPKLRKKMEKEFKKRGIGFLYRKLVKLDPEAAYIIDPQNSRRIIRALEVMLATNKPFTSQRRRGKALFRTLQIGISKDREKINKIIDKRVDRMLENGLVKEVRNLTKKYPKKLPAFDAIGYREIIGCLDGKIPLAEATGQIKKNTRRFARRQMAGLVERLGHPVRLVPSSAINFKLTTAADLQLARLVAQDQDRLAAALGW